MTEDSQEPTGAGTAAVAAEKRTIEGLAARLEDAGPCKKLLSVEIPPESVNARLRERMVELHRQAMLPGFRRGRAPLALIEKRFGGDLRKEVKSTLVVEGCRQALDENEVRPIAEPDVDLDAIEMKEGEPLKFELTVEVWPDFELQGYEGMKLERPASEPTDDEVEAEVNALRMRTTELEEVKEGPAKEDDFVLCDYVITSQEKEVASAKDVGVRPVDGVVGRYKVAGLKEALEGKTTGESVNLDFKIDDEHDQEELRGKDARLVLDIKGLRRPNVPDATDEWAEGLGFKSLEELRTVVARNVAASKERDADGDLRRQVYERLLGMMNFDLPEDAVRRQQKEIFGRERMGLQYRGATEEDLAKISDKLEEASLERAERELKLFFILSRIAEKEDVHATPADVDMRIAELAARYRTSAAKMRQQLEREEMLPEILLQVQEEKTVAHVLSTAKIAQAPSQGKDKTAAEKPAGGKSSAESEAAGRESEEKPGDSAEETPADDETGKGGE